MKGMEDEAGARDNEITAGELHSYVQTNVIQQSSAHRHLSYKVMWIEC